VPGTIQVQTPALAAAAGVIGSLKGATADARSDTSSAQAGAASFGGEPAGAAFDTACADALKAIDELEDTIGQLANNVAMAALGYLNTDLGVIPIDALHKLGGFNP
jgi:uncharacterized protein YukE